MKRYEKGRAVTVTVKTPDKYRVANLGTSTNGNVTLLCGNAVVPLSVEPGAKLRARVVDTDCWLPDDYEVVCKGEKLRVLPGVKVSFDSKNWTNEKSKEVVLWRRGDTCDFVIMYVGTHVAGLEE